MRVVPLRKDLLYLPRVLDHHTDASLILAAACRGHGRRKDCIEAMPGCRSFSSPNLLPREPGFLEEEDFILFVHRPLQARGAP
eukprot:3939427-Heterocapsa_arctica.AAC.2